MVEGVRAVEELLASPVRICGVLMTSQLYGAPRGEALANALRKAGAEQGFAVEGVDEDAFRTAASTETPQGVLAIAKIPKHSFEALIDRATSVRRLLVLDGVQDPGNVGTILRTAAALGVDATVALPGTVDLWNTKVVRGAMGAHFRHVAFHATVEELRAYLSAQQIPLWATDVQGEPLDTLRATLTPENRLAIAVGNEGAGISQPIAELAERTVSLPIVQVESLNVAVATGILLYELRV